MKKTALGFALMIPILSLAANYKSIINKESHNYIIGEISKTDPTDPTDPNNPIGALKYNEQPWIDVSSHNLSSFRPFFYDGSSSGQSAYKINVGQEAFQGDNLGFTPYDENFNSSNFINCGSGSGEGWCSVGNLERAVYDKTHSSGKYYFEITAESQAHADCLGMSINTATTATLSDVLGICYAGNYVAGYKWTNLDSNYTNYKNGGGQAAGTVYQVWIDYDKSLMAIKELGTDLSSYYYDMHYTAAETGVDLTSQAWISMASTLNIGNFIPAVFDGSGSGHSQTFTNFGQQAFSGDSKGFQPFDSAYDVNKWTNCALTTTDINSDGTDEDLCAVSYNGGVAYYDKSHTSGKYYYEITLKNQATAPYVDAAGLADRTNLNYYNTLGAQRYGYYEAGYNIGNGAGVNVDYKNTGAQPDGTIFQVWVDYDNRRISVMELGTAKDAYINYYNVFNDE